HERRSYAAAINAGLAATDAPAVLLLNADCVLDTGFLAAARPRLDERGVASVAPLVLRATGMEPGDRLEIVDAAGMTIDPRAKNETARGFARNAPFILGYEVLALGHALLRERTLLRGYVEAARLLSAARSRRQARPPQ